MALVNVKKKIEKAADKLGIAADETVIVGCTTNPSGTMKRMLARELGGALASAAASAKATESNPESGMAGRFDHGQRFLVLTNKRLLLTDVSLMTGSPKKIVSEWPRADVVTIAVDNGALSAPLTIVFGDGTAVQVEGAKGSNPKAVAEGWEAEQ